MADEDVMNLLAYAGENKPVDFTAALDAIMGRKAIDALAYAKRELATNLFKDSEEQYEDDDEYNVEDETDEEFGETDD